MAEETYRSTKAFERSGDKPHGLDEAFDDVVRFHQTFRFPIPSLPTLQSEKAVQTRIERIEEELTELAEADTVIDQADAYLDILYYAVGGLAELGVRPGELWRAVQRANMRKKDWPDGQPHYRDDGKVLKPPGWVGPEAEIAAEITRQAGV